MDLATNPGAFGPVNRRRRSDKPAAMHSRISAAQRPSMQIQSIINVAAVAERAAIAQAVGRCDGADVVHERRCPTPPALIKVARRTGVVARIGDVTAAGVATDVARPVSGGDDVGNETLKPRGD